jgi:hypothetical protein
MISPSWASSAAVTRRPYPLKNVASFHHPGSVRRPHRGIAWPGGHCRPPLPRRAHTSWPPSGDHRHSVDRRIGIRFPCRATAVPDRRCRQWALLVGRDRTPPCAASDSCTPRESHRRPASTASRYAAPFEQVLEQLNPDGMSERSQDPHIGQGATILPLRLRPGARARHGPSTLKEFLHSSVWTPARQIANEILHSC